MTFTCPNLDERDGWCTHLDTVCVPGRPGCVQGPGSYALSLEERIALAEERYRARPRRYHTLRSHDT